MKNNFLVGLLFLAGALFWSCSDDESFGNGDAVLNEGTQAEQVVYADEKGIKDGGIKFTTQGPWKAEVEEVVTRAAGDEGKAVDWLTLSQYSGDKAGDYTITLTLKQNYTGLSRKAVIRILCGGTVITITVEQKAEKEDGMKLKRVKSVDFVDVYGPGYKELDDSYDSYEADVNYTYSYDEQGRVAKVVQSYKDESSTYLFDYHIMDEITVIEKNDNFDPSIPDDYRCDHLITLNKEGNVENVRSTAGNGPAETFNAAYTADGRLAKLNLENSWESWHQNFFYTNGLLTKNEIKVNDYDADVYEFDIAKVYPNRYPANGANIDFNAFILEPGDEDITEILFSIGLLGKGSDCLMEIRTNHRENEEDFISELFTEPDKVYTYTKKKIKFSEKEMYPVEYELDGDKYVKKFSYAEPYEVYEYYYEIHVGHELLVPDYPERGYKYEIKNEKMTKLSDERNTYTWTVTYE